MRTNNSKLLRGESSAPDSSPPDRFLLPVRSSLARVTQSWAARRLWYGLQLRPLMSYNCTIPSTNTTLLVSWDPCKFRTSVLNSTLHSTGNPCKRCLMYRVLCISPATHSNILFCSVGDNNIPYSGTCHPRISDYSTGNDWYSGVRQPCTGARYNHNTILEDSVRGDCRDVGC